MPRFDKTGPEGKGPMTGRGLGPCNPENKEDNTSNFPGLGRGQGSLGRGLGRGLGRRGRGRN
jgi:hypothetical protein